MFYTDMLFFILLGTHTNSNTGDTYDTISRYQIVVLKCTLYA